MKTSREYHIHLAALKEASHLFQYIIEDSFFQQALEEFHNINVEVDVQLIKQADFLQLHIKYYGQVETVCDRCMAERLPIQINQEFNVLVKRVAEIPLETTEEDPFIIYISRLDAFFDIYGLLVDLFFLSIPLVKQCNTEEFEAKTYCDKEVLAYISNTNNETASLT